MEHHTRLGIIPVARPVHQAAVVPHDDIACCPAVLIHPAFVRNGELEKSIDQGSGIRTSHVGNAIGVPTDCQRLPPGFRMDLDQWPQRHVLNIKTVADIFAVAGLGFLAQFGLAMGKRMMGRKVGDQGLHVIVQRVIGRAHVGEGGVALGRRNPLGAEHGAFGLQRHIGVVLMPVHIASNDFHHIVVRRIPFAFDEGIDPVWNPAHHEWAHMFNGASLTMPYLEPFLIKTVREAIKHVDDEALKEEVNGFMGQTTDFKKDFIKPKNI